MRAPDPAGGEIRGLLYPVRSRPVWRQVKMDGCRPVIDPVTNP